MKNIVLIGLSGSGKTTIGELLSKRLGMEFYDSDVWVQEKEGRTIAEMFADAEDTFREAETRAIQELSAKEGVYEYPLPQARVGRGCRQKCTGISC